MGQGSATGGGVGVLLLFCGAGSQGRSSKGWDVRPPSLGGLRAGVLEESTHRLCLPKPCWKGWGTLLLHGALGSAVASAGAEGSGGGELQQERSAQEG